MYRTIHCITFDITLYHTALHGLTLKYSTLQYTKFQYITLHYMIFHFAALHCISLHYIVLQYSTLHYTKIHYTTYNTALHYSTVHEKVHYTTPHYIIYTGWWFQPLWKILVSWDNYSQYMEKYIMFQTTRIFHYTPLHYFQSPSPESHEILSPLKTPKGQPVWGATYMMKCVWFFPSETPSGNDCYIAIENGPCRNPEFSNSKWWIFPYLYWESPFQTIQTST